MQSIEESPWDDTPSAAPTHAEAEWTRLSSGFQNAGYRDGITAGKEGALQEGFDAGFAQAGAPRGRELGLLRGLASALLLHLAPPARETASTSAARDIVDALAAVRFDDIAPPPPPEEAEHVHDDVHVHGVGKTEGNGEDRPGEGSAGPKPAATTIEDVRALGVRLEGLLREVGVEVDLDFESFDS
ncbi:hypothetical protein BC826DRAFT_1040622 [Russula brevipes]|nr:hypothetical protein BC826DRAFT_1040622 [Russula brevipes]